VDMNLNILKNNYLTGLFIALKDIMNIKLLNFA